MNFLTYCGNKGCRTEMTPVIDKDTKEVFCTACGGKMENVSIHMKQLMLSSNLVKKKFKSKLAFSVKCLSCHKEDEPYVKNDKIYCTNCKAEIKNLTQPFAEMLKKSLKKI